MTSVKLIYEEWIIIAKIRIAVVAGMKKNSLVICKQLNALFGDIFDFIYYTDKDWENVAYNFDLVLISTHTLFSRQSNVGITNQNNVKVINRTLLKSGYEMISNLTPNEKFLIVNDDRDSTIETISLLYELGIRDVELIPVYPGITEVTPILSAITPGEANYVPEHVETIYDVGERVVDISTLVEILTHFDLLNNETQQILDDYAETIITRSHGFQDILHGLIEAGDFFHEALNLVEDGFVTYNQNAIINIFNRKAEEIFKIQSTDVVGMNINEFFRKLTIDEKLLNEEVVDFLIKVDNQNLILNKKSIGNKTRSYGGVLTFKVSKQVEDLEKKLRIQLKADGHAAKYTFDNIVTQNKDMKKIISHARKMAASDLSVLITGESGTGKELFAHSIHTASPRSTFPFIAINCSSLPDNLLESELFGYEEGAFTGARKGGKPGLFEQAHGGTIFLDEIGDVSPNLQTRLLRILQQKEVLKIGGTKVLPVDVRIVAATNRNLLQRIKEGEFREDLYYRLNVLQLKVPPLRNRKEDISLLVDHFFERRKISTNLPTDVMETLMEHQWPGNIREFENTIEYLALMSDGEILVEDIPLEREYDGWEPNYSKIEIKEKQLDCIVPIESLDLGMNDLVLNLLLKARRKGLSSGRRSIVKLARQEGIIVSESQVRKAVDSLRESGMIEVSIGRTGSNLTPKGLETLHLS